MEYLIYLAIGWGVNVGLNSMFFNDPPPPPQHKICYEVVNEGKTLVPYECVGGKSE
jgi:hypothetical protein